MALLDRAGRVLSRIFGLRRVAREQSAKSIAESRLNKRKLQFQTGLDAIRAIQRDERLRQAGLTPTRGKLVRVLNEKGKAKLELQRLKRLAELGIEEIEPIRIEPSTVSEQFIPTEKFEPVWIVVSSSNVQRIRWVGGVWGLQVDFKNGYRYEYAVPFSIYLEMLTTPSKGKFVWWMRRSGVAYRRYNPTSIPPRIIYRWGHIGGPTSEGEYQRPPVGQSRGPRMFNPALGKPGAPAV